MSCAARSLVTSDCTYRRAGAVCSAMPATMITKSRAPTAKWKPRSSRRTRVAGLRSVADGPPLRRRMQDSRLSLCQGPAHRLGGDPVDAMRQEAVGKQSRRRLTWSTRQPEGRNHTFVGHDPYRRPKRDARPARYARIQLGDATVERAVDGAKCQMYELPRQLLAPRARQLLAEDGERGVRYLCGGIV